jgi:hypothetical protein
MLERQPIEDLRKRLSVSAYKYGLRGPDIEDAISEITTRMLEGRHQHSTLDQAVIDYIRAQYGDKRTVGHDQRKMLHRKNTEELHETIRSDRGLFDSSKYGALEYGESARELYRLVIGQKKKIVFHLLYIWGFNEAEVGDIFGVTSSGVSQWNKEIQNSLQLRVREKKQREASRDMASILQKENDNYTWRVEFFEDKGMEKIKSW